MERCDVVWYIIRLLVLLLLWEKRLLYCLSALSFCCLGDFCRTFSSYLFSLQLFLLLGFDFLFGRKVYYFDMFVYCKRIILEHLVEFVL